MLLHNGLIFRCHYTIEFGFLKCSLQNGGTHIWLSLLQKVARFFRIFEGVYACDSEVLFNSWKKWYAIFRESICIYNLDGLENYVHHLPPFMSKCVEVRLHWEVVLLLSFLFCSNNTSYRYYTSFCSVVFICFLPLSLILLHIFQWLYSVLNILPC